MPDFDKLFMVECDKLFMVDKPSSTKALDLSRSSAGRSPHATSSLRLTSVNSSAWCKLCATGARTCGAVIFLFALTITV
jgi:hypothetical protein